MYIVVTAWLYVALMMAAAEAGSPHGTVFGAVVTFVLYGAGPVALLIFLMGRPAQDTVANRLRRGTTPRLSPRPGRHPLGARGDAVRGLLEQAQDRRA